MGINKAFVVESISLENPRYYRLTSWKYVAVIVCAEEILILMKSTHGRKTVW